MSFSTEYGDDEETTVLEPESAEVLA
jgi:putative mRNA 3-end processing factor